MRKSCALLLLLLREGDLAPDINTALLSGSSQFAPTGRKNQEEEEEEEKFSGGDELWHVSQDGGKKQNRDTARLQRGLNIRCFYH